ncbi:unnamed protein product [Prorocentrum cordatum]|uniref:Uncharacterized protein n=1 Tax=Prorocentrum cordatum TaxID=2364126 RepID=A0ABN9VD73_9DINO|nr:unnamed protein product [Polarella glacialis]
MAATRGSSVWRSADLTIPMPFLRLQLRAELGRRGGAGARPRVEDHSGGGGAHRSPTSTCGPPRRSATAHSSAPTGSGAPARSAPANPMANVSRDRIRTLQARLDSVMDDAYDADEARPGIDMAAELLELYDRAPLGPKSIRADACYAAFVLSLKADDLAGAKGWVRKAYQHSLVARGKDHPDTKVLEKLVKDPEDSPFSKKNDPQEAAVNVYVALGGIVSLGMLFQIFQSLARMQRMADPFA